MGNNVIGNNCKIGEYVMLDNCIVFDNAEVKTGAELTNCIVLPVQNELSVKKNSLTKNNSVVTV